jgi:hypothetical protein
MRTFYYVRVAVLSAILLVVIAYAAHDMQRRRARTAWIEPIKIGIVVLELETSEQRLAPDVLADLIQGFERLEERLNDEFRRYRPGAADAFNLEPHGPILVTEAPPSGDVRDAWSLVRQTYELWRYTARVNRAGAVPAAAFDSMIYVTAEPAGDDTAKFVEGFSQQGGTVGVTRIQLDASTVDLCLFVIAHELMHTLGATDRYDASGRTLLPVGLGDPDQVPLYPQLRTEVMARNRVLAPGEEVPPDALDELRVGPSTAAEIGWLAAQPPL